MRPSGGYWCALTDLSWVSWPDGGYPQKPVTAAVSGDPSDEAILAAAVDLAAICHTEVHLLHTHPLPLRRSDSPEERWAGRAVLESVLRQLLRLTPDYTPSTELLRLQAQEAVGHHCGDGLLVVGARCTPHPGLGLVTRTALHHARSPVAVPGTTVRSDCATISRAASVLRGAVITGPPVVAGRGRWRAAAALRSHRRSRGGRPRAWQ